MKSILAFLIFVAILLCSCTNASVKSDNDVDNGSSSVTEEASVFDSELAETDVATTNQESNTDVTKNSTAESKKPAFPPSSELRNRPDGKEVSIFKDNTFDCDYSGYKEIGYNFGDLRFSVKAPETWNSFRFYGEDEIYQNILIGFPLYNRPLDVKIVTSDDSTRFANDPLNKSTFFLAWTHGLGLEENLSSFTKFYGYQTKYDYETYVDKQGRSMKVYFLDGLPRLAVYDDFFDRCIVFNLENEDQIPIVVNMINSIEVSLSSDAMFALQTAERLGYTIIPPKE